MEESSHSRRKTFTLSQAQPQSQQVKGNKINETLPVNNTRQINPCNQTFLTAGGLSSATKSVRHPGLSAHTTISEAYPSTSSSAAFAIPRQSMKNPINAPVSIRYDPKNNFLSSSVLSVNHHQHRKEQLFATVPKSGSKQEKEKALKALCNAWGENNTNVLCGLVERAEETFNAATADWLETTVLNSDETSMGSASEELFESSTENAALPEKKSGSTLEQLRVQKQELIDKISWLESTTVLIDQECIEVKVNIEKELADLEEKKSHYKKRQKEVDGKQELIQDKMKGKLVQATDKKFTIGLTDELFQTFLKVDVKNNYKCTDERLCKALHKRVCFPSSEKV